jgi:hypothetical protein
MFVLSASTIAIVVLSGVTAFFVGKWLYSKDEAAEDHKRAAIRVSSLLTSMGLVRLPRVLECYAVNDWSQLAVELKMFAELALDEKAVAAEFESVFKNVLAKKSATAEGRAYIAAVLTEATPV